MACIYKDTKYNKDGSSRVYFIVQYRIARSKHYLFAGRDLKKAEQLLQVAKQREHRKIKVKKSLTVSEAHIMYLSKINLAPIVRENLYYAIHSLKGMYGDCLVHDLKLKDMNRLIKSWSWSESTSHARSCALSSMFWWLFCNDYTFIHPFKRFN